MAKACRENAGKNDAAELRELIARWRSKPAT